MRGDRAGGQHFHGFVRQQVEAVDGDEAVEFPFDAVGTGKAAEAAEVVEDAEVALAGGHGAPPVTLATAARADCNSRNSVSSAKSTNADGKLSRGLIMA